MTVDHAPADPVRLVGLLWSPSEKVGRTGLTVETLVRTAIELADAHGLAHLTMRALADEVGVGTMTLYRYVPGRTELLALMLDQVAGTVYDGRGLPRSKRTMPRAIEHIAQCNWEHLMRHRWITEIAPGRPIVGPGECRKYENELVPLDNRGLTDQEMDSLLASVLALVAATARWQVGMDEVRTTSRLSDEQWWAETGPALSRVLVRSNFPVSARVGTSVASAGDPRATLDYALGALLDTVTARLADN